jgi:hypothetical protein
MRYSRSFAFICGAVLFASAQAVTPPEGEFGFRLGDDYQLATYTQLSAYWRKLEKESPRMKLVEIGKTAEGRPQLMAILTAPENHKKLARYREIARRLALAEDLSDEQAQALAAEGKAVVWIDGGLHATEVLGAQQLMELVYQLVSRSDPETLRILHDVIVLAVHANPDGHELVAGWYMREADPRKRSLSGVPRLYQKYIGHDNNRDSYLSSQAETINMNRVLFREWFPQIMYNHHQSGPAGSVMFAPPFRPPYNYSFDPLVVLGIEMVGAAMHSRFAAEGKPGLAMRRGAPYSNWFNGGMRSTTCFHNMIGLLTETIGNPTPMAIPFIPDRLLATANHPYPITPQAWHFRQSIEYSLTANRAVLDFASKHRQDLLFRIYRMGRNSIERGSRDHWTMTPTRVPKNAAGLRDPATRDARAYILPSSQPDFLTATKFMNSLIRTGVTIHRATAAFEAAGRSYPAGSYVVQTAQAFRPHIIDLFEPQDYPNDIPYPGGPPIPPYDNAGWTLAFQMGVAFDRMLEGVEGPFEKITDEILPPAGRITGPANPAGYLLSHQVNDAFRAVNSVLRDGGEVFWMNERNGEMFIRSGNRPLLEKLAAEVGLNFAGVAERPAGPALRLRPVRIGLWDRYGGSMPSGWVRWLFEQYEFPFEVIFNEKIEAGNLHAAYDVLVFVDGGIPASATAAARVAAAVRDFLERGGTVLAIGSSTNLARHLKLPVAAGVTQPRERFYVPGSLLQVRVDNRHPLAWGMPEKADVFFNSSPVFTLGPDSLARGLRPVAWFDSASPLRSGWAWGQHFLEGTAAVVEATVGRGKLFLYGPEVTFRAQPHGTFKLFFNGIYYGPAAGD